MINSEHAAEVLNVDDVMDELRVGRNTVYRLLKDNTLKGFKVGDHWRISRYSLDSYILSHSGYDMKNYS